MAILFKNGTNDKDLDRENREKGKEPELNQTKVHKESQSIGPEKTPESTSGSGPDFEKAIREKRHELNKRMDKLRSNVSVGTADPIAVDRMLKLLEKQRNELTALLAARNAKAAEELMTQLELTFTRGKSGETMTTDEIYNTSKLWIGAEKALKENKPFQDSFQKLLEGRDVNDEEYKPFLEVLHSINATSDDKRQFLDATSVGSAIYLMSPAQRYHFVELYLQTYRRPEGLALIGQFLSNGVLNPAQVDIMAKNGLITQQEFLENFKSKIDDGSYEKAVTEIRNFMEEEKKSDYYGQFAHNFTDKFVGMPLIGGLVAVWGLILSGLQIAANSKNLKELGSNPYFYLGVAGMGFGTEIMTSSMKGKGAPFIGEGVIGTALDSIGGKSEEERSQERAKRNFAKLYTNSPELLGTYLRNGGFAKIRDQRRRKEQQGLTGTKLQFTLDDLVELSQSETGEQKARLKAMMELPPNQQESFFIKMLTFTELTALLKIDTQDQFNRELADIDKAQVHQSNPVRTNGSQPTQNTNKPIFFASKN